MRSGRLHSEYVTTQSLTPPFEQFRIAMSDASAMLAALAKA
jgi:hypothetical protein